MAEFEESGPAIPPPPPPSLSHSALPPPSGAESAEVLKPQWWKRKRVLIPLGILLLLIALSDPNTERENESKPVEAGSSVAPETSNAVVEAPKTSKMTSEAVETSSVPVATESTTTTRPPVASLTTASTTLSGPSTEAVLTSTTEFSFDCRYVFAKAAAVSAMEDGWPDIFPAFEDCPSVDAMVAAAEELDPDGRWDGLVGNTDFVIKNLCDREGWPDGPHGTTICADFVE